MTLTPELAHTDIEEYLRVHEHKSLLLRNR